jgi:hypothetical protein
MQHHRLVLVNTWHFAPKSGIIHFMKILNRAEFFEQPAGILYRKCIPNWEPGQIQIKGDNCGPDFACMSFGYAQPRGMGTDWPSHGTSRPTDLNYYGRDGGFQRDALFLVYETWDLEQMRGVIDHAITVAPKQVFHHPWDK